MMINIIVAAILFTTTVNLDSDTGILRDMNVSYGTYSDKISIKWVPVQNGNYSIMRSEFKDRGFTEIAVTDDTNYEDRSITPGIKYWYKIKLIKKTDPEKESLFDSIASAFFGDDPFISSSQYIKTEEPELTGNITADTKKLAETGELDKIKSDVKDPPVVASQSENNYSGFALRESPKGANLDRLIAMKKDTLRNPASKDQRDIQNRRLEYLKQFYMNQVQFSIIMLMARPYLNRGDLLIFTDHSFFEFNDEKKTITFYDRSKSYSVIFESKRMHRIIKESDDKELRQILLRNAELYCVPSGKREYLDEDGKTSIIYTYDAIGLSTRYLKNDAQWRSRTIMAATSRSDLKEQMMKASNIDSKAF